MKKFLKKKYFIGLALILILGAGVYFRLPPKLRPVIGECTVTINCTAIENHRENLKDEKLPFVPRTGYIAKDFKMEVHEGDTVYTIVSRFCKENTCIDNCKFCQVNKDRVPFESSFVSGNRSYYVESIHNLSERDCGAGSGWIFTINGEMKGTSASLHSVNPGDRIEWIYACDYTTDIVQN